MGQALQRMVAACAAAGVAVVLVPNFDGCRVFSASKWLVWGSRRKVALIALSIRYRRDDQLYFSLFREAGAILAAHRRIRPCAEPKAGAFHPDQFARELVIPPELDQELATLTAAADLERAVVTFARKAGVCPGLVVGRMQHDGLIGWKKHNGLKSEVDLTWVLKTADAIEGTWPDQQAATRGVMQDLGLDARAERERVRRAVAAGAVPTNGLTRKAMRLDPQALTSWRLMARDRDVAAADSEAVPSRREPETVRGRHGADTQQAWEDTDNTGAEEPDEAGSREDRVLAHMRRVRRELRGSGPATRERSGGHRAA